MYKIVGVKSHYTVIDGKPYTGYWVYFTTDWYQTEGVSGVYTGSAYLRERVAKACNYAPVVGDDVKMRVVRGKNGTSLVQWIYPQ